MKIEDELKQLILSRYKTMHDFADQTGMKYTTLMSIMTRGILNSSISNIIRICQSLGISADALSEGKIVYVKKETKELSELVNTLNSDLSLDGVPMSEDEIDTFLNAVGIAIEMIRRKR